MKKKFKIIEEFCLSIFDYEEFITPENMVYYHNEIDTNIASIMISIFEMNVIDNKNIIAIKMRYCEYYDIIEIKTLKNLIKIAHYKKSSEEFIIKIYTTNYILNKLKNINLSYNYINDESMTYIFPDINKYFYYLKNKTMYKLFKILLNPQNKKL